MKTFVCAWIMLVASSLWADQMLDEREFGRIADAIYIIEGGTNASSPYGILSVKVKDVEHARQVCLNTIRANHDRWMKSGHRGRFLDFLADRYCPQSVDAVGNKNWKRNIRLVVAKLQKSDNGIPGARKSALLAESDKSPSAAKSPSSNP